MATPDIEPQRVHEFIENILDDLAAGRVTPEAALIAASQYATLREGLRQNTHDFSSLVGPDGGIAKERLDQALRLVFQQIHASPPQIQAERPDSPIPPREILERASSLVGAEKIIAETTRGQALKTEALRKTFISRLVARWIASSRENALVDKGEALRRSAGVVPADRFIDGSAGRALEQSLRDHGVDQRAIQASLHAEQPSRQELAASLRTQSALRGLPRELFSRASIPNLERYALIASSLIAARGLPAGEAAARADDLSRAAEALAGRRPSADTALASNRFWTDLAQGPAQKMAAAFADTLFSQLSPLARADVARTAFSRALERALAKTDALTTRLGKDFVQNEVFQKAIERARVEFSHDPNSGQRKARGALEDILSSILMGPVTAPLLTSPREAILQYFELLAINAGLPEGRKINLGGPPGGVVVPPGGPGRARSGSMDPAAYLALVRGVGGVAMPGWESFYLIVVSLVSPESALLLSRDHGAPSLESLGAPAGRLGSAVGGALARAGLGLAGFAARAGGGLVGLLFGGVPFSPFGRRTEKTGFWDDTPLMISVFIGAAIILLFILPTFFNITFIRESAKNAALLVESFRLSGRGFGIEGKDKFEYNGPSPAPPSAVSGCPIGQALFSSISQCPNDSRPDYSHYFTHAWSNAYDIALPASTEVYATHNGNLVEYVSDIPQNGGSDYGNYVVLAGTDPAGKLYFTIYGHLLTVSDTIKNLCGGALRCSSSGAARPVENRTLLGKTDNTGASTGPHLHYELRNADGSKPPFVLPVGCGGYQEGLACGSL
ncbi:M23 family metallopeptidase [Candidatus Gottesmanbacteria bacterium]|nr:M23 family metallopeptidase [Candidatus Gottesmanbacteria bacterium]